VTLQDTALSDERISATWARSICLLVGLTVWWSAWGYLQAGAAYGDDNSSHLAWMMAVSDILRQGHTDFFFEQQNLGVAMFMAYQPLPGLLLGGIHALFASWIAPWTLFKIAIIALWSLMPLVWYIGGRWLGLSRVTAVCLGVLILGIHDQHFYGLTLRTFVYRGLHSQLFGMFFLPLVLGSLYRYLVRRESFGGRSVLFFALTFLSHAFFGIYVGIASFLMLCLTRERLKERVLRASFVYAVTILCISFWMFPLLFHVGEVGGLPWKQAIHQGWQWTAALSHLLGGEIFDVGRPWPWMTCLVLAGLASALTQPEARLHRWLLLLMGVTFLMLLGRTQWGALYNALPLHREINAMRYIMGIHLCGVLLICTGLERWLSWLSKTLLALTLERYGISAVVLGLLVVGGAFLNSRMQDQKKILRTFPHQNAPFQSVSRYLARDKKHRYIAHRLLGTTNHFHRDLLAALSKRPHLQSFGLTFHATLGLYYTEAFDFKAPSYRLYNVSTLVTQGKEPEIDKKHLKLALHRPPYRVYEHTSSFGYFDFVRRAGHISGKPKAVRPILRALMLPLYKKNLLPQLWVSKSERKRVQKWLALPSAKRVDLPEPWGNGHLLVVESSGQYRWFVRGKEVRPVPSLAKIRERLLSAYLPSAQRIPKMTSSILSQAREQGMYTAKVQVKDPRELLFLKVNTFPYWRVFVNGKKADFFRIAPNYMALSLPLGLHKVQFRYQNPLMQKIFFVICMLGLMVVGVFSFREMSLERKILKEEGLQEGE